MTLDEAKDLIYRRLLDECLKQRNKDAKLECQPLADQLNIPPGLFNDAIKSLNTDEGGTRVRQVDGYSIQLGPRGHEEYRRLANPT